MKIMVFGNICSGKSYLVNEVDGMFPGFEIVSVDDFRRRYGDGSMESEKRAKEVFLNAIVDGENQIVEAMGTGDTGEAIRERVQNFSENVFVIILTTALPVCLERLSKRGCDVPYPAPKENARGLAMRMSHFFESDELSSRWKTLPNCWVVEANTTTSATTKLKAKLVEIIDETN